MRLFARYITAGLLAVALLALSFGTGARQAEAAPALLPRVGTVSVAFISGTPTAGTPGTATYTVTVMRATTQSLIANLSISGLPAGASASFSPASVSWNTGSGNGTTRTSTLTITTASTTPAGTTTFTVRAQRNTSPGDFATGTGTLAVSAAAAQPATVTISGATTATYGNSFSATVSTSSNGAVSMSASGPCAQSGQSGLTYTFNTTGAGDCTLTASTAATSAYLAGASAPHVVTIAQAAQSISFAALADMPLGSADFAVVATASSGLAVSLSSGTPATCAVAGSTVSLLGEGACTITASQAGDANYLAAAPVAQTFTVTAPLAGGCALDGSTRTCNLWAKSGTISLPGQSLPVPVWSYTDSASGAPGAVGPTLYAVAGESLTINLTNQLGEATSLQISGLGGKADPAGAAPGGQTSYSFANLPAGTYVYQAGILTGSGPRQIAMGMAGALVVREAAANTAYGHSFDDEAVLVYSEIDPAFNRNPAGFVLQKFRPAYLLVNGKVYPNTDAIASAEGHALLLRQANVGMRFHSLGVMGLRQTIIAEDGSSLPISSSLFARTLGAGQTMDALVQIPASVVDGSKYAIIETGMPAHGPAGVNGMGGMLSFITAGGTGTGTGTGGGTGGDTVAPTVSSINRAVASAISKDASVSFIVTFSESVSGVDAADFSLATGGTISGASVTGVSGSGSSYTVTVGTGSGSGSVGLNIAGAGGIQDAAGNPLGGLPFSGEAYTIDRQAPTINLATTSPVNLGAAVGLSGTISDSLSGVAAASYTLGATTKPIAVGAGGSVSTAISTTGLATGTYSVTVSATDAAGNSSTQVLSFTIADSVFSDNFDAGNFNAWTSRSTTTASRLSITTAAHALSTARGLQAAFGSGSSANNYVEKVLGGTETRLNVRFYVNPHGQNFGSGAKIIFRALGDVNGVQTEAFRLAIQRVNATTYQVRAYVARQNGTSSTTRVTLPNPNGDNYVELAWASGASTQYQLIVNGGAPVTLSNLLTSAYTVNTLRLGVQTSGTSGTNIYLDEFKVTRGTLIGAGAN